MRTRIIYEYELLGFNSNTQVSISAPVYFEPLSVGIREDKIFVWGMSTPKNKIKDNNLKNIQHYFLVIPTGFKISESEFDNSEFLGTVFLEGFTFHVFYKGHQSIFEWLSY